MRWLADWDSGQCFQHMDAHDESMTPAQVTDVCRAYDCISITRALQQLFRHNVIERLLISDSVFTSGWFGGVV